MFYIDSNVFLYPIIYEVGAVEEAKRSRDLLLRIAFGDIKAYTSIITWDEVVWRRIFGLEPSVEQGKFF